MSAANCIGWDISHTFCLNNSSCIVRLNENMLTIDIYLGPELTSQSYQCILPRRVPFKRLTIQIDKYATPSP